MSKLLPFANALLYLVTCGLTASGLVLEWRLEDRADGLLGLSRHDWAELHFIVAWAFLALVVAHLALNRASIKAALTRHRAAVPVLLGGLVLLGAVLLWPARPAGRSGEGDTRSNAAGPGSSVESQDVPRHRGHR